MLWCARLIHRYWFGGQTLPGNIRRERMNKRGRVIKVNWFRGMTRLWLALTVPWIAATAYLHSDSIGAAYRDLRESETVEVDEEACAEPASPDQTAICELQRRLKRQTEITRGRARDDLVGAGQWIVLPPALLAFLMAAVAWVIRGFRA